MVQCKKCKLFLSTSKDDVVKCRGSCEAVFHKKCVKNLKQFTLTGLCESCANCTSPKPTNIHESETNVESILQDINKKLAVVFKMEKKLEEISEAVDFYAEQYQKLMEFKETAERKLKALEQKNENLDKCNRALEERIHDLEERGLERNLEIIGVEKQDSENVYTVVTKIAQILKVNANDIESVARVGREKGTESKPQPLVVSLKSKSARNQWLASRKSVVITNDILYNNSKNGKRIYINENLTKYKRQLFWNAKLRLKDAYKYIWVQDSNILVRSNDDARKIHKIKNDSDIEKLLTLSVGNNTRSSSTK